MAIGKLWNFFGTAKGTALLAGQFVLVLAFAFLYTGYHASDRCVSCHADADRMTRLGYPQFVMTREQVQ